MKEYAKKVVIPTSSEVKDYEISEKGFGIVVLKAPAGSTVRFNSLLSDPISLVDIESIYLPFEKIYVSSPASTVPITLLILKEKVYIDANSQYSVLAKTGEYLHSMLLASARRGNYAEKVHLDPAAGSTTVEKPQNVGPFRIANIISFTPLQAPTGWTLTAVNIRPDTKEMLTSTLDLSFMDAFMTFHINAISLTFTPSSSSSAIDVIVEYLFTPAWEA